MDREESGGFQSDALVSERTDADLVYSNHPHTLQEEVVPTAGMNPATTPPTEVNHTVVAFSHSNALANSNPLLSGESSSTPGRQHSLAVPPAPVTQQQEPPPPPLPMLAAGTRRASVFSSESDDSAPPQPRKPVAPTPSCCTSDSGVLGRLAQRIQKLEDGTHFYDTADAAAYIAQKDPYVPLQPPSMSHFLPHQHEACAPAAAAKNSSSYQPRQELFWLEDENEQTGEELARCQYAAGIANCNFRARLDEQARFFGRRHTARLIPIYNQGCLKYIFAEAFDSSFDIKEVVGVLTFIASIFVNLASAVVNMNDSVTQDPGESVLAWVRVLSQFIFIAEFVVIFGLFALFLATIADAFCRRGIGTDLATDLVTLGTEIAGFSSIKIVAWISPSAASRWILLEIKRSYGQQQKFRVLLMLLGYIGACVLAAATVILKLTQIDFTSSVPIADWTLSQWLQLIGLIMNLSKVDGSYSTETRCLLDSVHQHFCPPGGPRDENPKSEALVSRIWSFFQIPRRLHYELFEVVFDFHFGTGAESRRNTTTSPVARQESMASPQLFPPSFSTGAQFSQDQSSGVAAPQPDGGAAAATASAPEHDDTREQVVEQETASRQQVEPEDGANRQDDIAPESTSVEVAPLGRKSARKRPAPGEAATYTDYVVDKEPELDNLFSKSEDRRTAARAAVAAEQQQGGGDAVASRRSTFAEWKHDVRKMLNFAAFLLKIDNELLRQYLQMTQSPLHFYASGRRAYTKAYELGDQLTMDMTLWRSDPTSDRVMRWAHKNPKSFRLFLRCEDPSHVQLDQSEADEL